MSRVRRFLREQAPRRWSEGREESSASTKHRVAGPEGRGRMPRSPTPISNSPRIAMALVVGRVVFGLVLYLAPVVLTVMLGGVALAIVLSFLV